MLRNTVLFEGIKIGFSTVVTRPDHNVYKQGWRHLMSEASTANVRLLIIKKNLRKKSAESS